MVVGDFKTETFDKDELAALGEAEVTAPVAEKTEPKENEGPAPVVKPEGEEPPEGEKPKTEPKAEPTAEEKAAAEDQGFRIETDDKGHTYIIDDDGTKIPPKRFREVYREAKEGERTKEKFDLFKKLGPEGYYSAYPDEMPEGRQPARNAPIETIPVDADIGALIVKQPNGPYDGMALRDVYATDPVFATKLETDYLWQQKQAETDRVFQQERVRQESATEIETFAETVAQELFGKTAKGLTKSEEQKVTDTIQEVLDFMYKTHRGGGLISDAYFLMNKEGLLKGAANKAANAVIKNLQDRKGPLSIDTGKGGDIQETGFDAYDKMTEAQFADVIDKMPEKQLIKFFKEAPKSLKAKYPKIPWD